MTEFDLLRKRNEEFRQQAVDRLCTGSAKDYAEYRELVGVIRGLDHASLSITDLEKRLRKADDE